MSDPIPVNPDVLRWARDSMRLSLEEVAGRMNKRVSDIEAWERGDESPTYIQLERLAYDIYKRPVALFFFPDVRMKMPLSNRFVLCRSRNCSVYPRVSISCCAGPECFN